MLDFTDLTTVVKKTTKKATDLAMKPVHFVTDPVLDVHQKLKTTVFWPDLLLLETLKANQQKQVFSHTYLTHLDQVAKTLHTNKLPEKKLHAYLQACKLIHAAPATTLSLEETHDMMQELFDELRMSCKQWIPTKLSDNVFSVDAKISFTEDEFEIISTQIAASKKFLAHLVNTVENDMIPLLLTDKPNSEDLIQNAQSKRTQFSQDQKRYQDSVFQYNDIINTWRPLVNNIADICEYLRRYTNKQNSLFWPEKTKYKAEMDKELKKLTVLVKKEFPSRLKKVTTQGTDVAHLYVEQNKLLPAMSEQWKIHFAHWQKREKNCQTDLVLTKKTYASTLHNTQKNSATAQKALQTAQLKAKKQIEQPCCSVELFHQHIDDVHTHHASLHDAFLAVAEHIWQSGVRAELPLCGDELQVTERNDYLREEMLLLRLQLLSAKLIKRVWKSMADTVRSYENTLDDRKVYAKELLATPLKQLGSLNTLLQEQVKSLEKQIKSYETILTNDKNELRDSVLCNRLLAYKRTWQEETRLGVIWIVHSATLHAEIMALTTRKKMLEWAEKDLTKKQNIDRTALDEQEKTVTLVKTKEQKKKLVDLKTLIQTQDGLHQEILRELELCSAHLEETTHLQKKYELFGKQQQAHAQRYKKYIDAISKKIQKSPLSQWIDCSNQLITIFTQ